MPAEVYAEIFAYLSKNQASAVRMTSKRLEPTASWNVFASVSLRPFRSPSTETTFDNVRFIAQHEKHSKSVRRVIIDGPLVPADASGTEGGSVDHNALHPDFDQAISDIREKMTGVKDVFVRFSRWVPRTLEEEDDEDVQTTEYRQELMQAVVNGLASAQHPVRGLSIENLQDINDPGLLESPQFRTLLQGLKTYRLRITREIPESDIQLLNSTDATFNFLQEMPKRWLDPPLLPRLTSLTLHLPITTTFSRRGPDRPMIDLSTCVFPELKYLYLGNYGIWDKNQVQWILEHRKLTSLSLLACPIVYLFVCTSPNGEYVNPNHDPQDVQNIIEYHRRNPDSYERLGDHVFQTTVRWNHIFDQFKELPELKQFTFNTRNPDVWDLPLSKEIGEESKDIGDLYGKPRFRYTAYDEYGTLETFLTMHIAGKYGEEYHPYFLKNGEDLNDPEYQGQKDLFALEALLIQTKQLKNQDEITKFEADFKADGDLAGTLPPLPSLSAST